MRLSIAGQFRVEVSMPALDAARPMEIGRLIYFI
jgi:hypothetical protein